MPGHYTVIGGYESGVDAAVNLLKLGHRVRLLARRPTWDLPEVYDPSQMLSPYARERLRKIESSNRLETVFGADVTEVTTGTDSGFRIHAADGRHWDTAVPPQQTHIKKGLHDSQEPARRSAAHPSQRLC